MPIHIDIPLPSMALLRCFDAAARHESFTAAAEELNMTQGAVSRQIKELEAQLDTLLFHREGRGVRLTGPGKALAPLIQSDLRRLRSTIGHAIASGSKREVLTISAPPTFASRWLVPRLPAFRATHPDLELYMISRADPFDMLEEKVDIAIHCGRANWPATSLTPLSPENLVIVASPNLPNARAGMPLSEIFDLPLLHNATRTELWRRLHDSHFDTPRAMQSGSYFDQLSLLIAAAVACMGAAILPTYLVENEVRSGELIVLSTPKIPTSESYFIARPAGIRNPLAKEFQDWIRKQVSSQL